MGKSYSSKHDFARHLYQARGSLYQTMTQLDLLKRKGVITGDKFLVAAHQVRRTIARLPGRQVVGKPTNQKQIVVN